MAARAAAAVQLVVWLWPQGRCTVTCVLQAMVLGCRALHNKNKCKRHSKK